MSRFVGALPAVALAVALFACARSASEPVGGGTPDAAIPPSGNTPTPDGGTEAPPGNPAPDAGSAGSPAVVPPGATLIDPGPIKGIYSASSDGRTVLVSRQTSGPPYWTGDLIVEHGGKATVVATEGVEWAQFFSADGSAFLFSVNGIIHLARSDGTVVPGIALGPGDHTMVGRWLYYHQVASDGQLQLFRRIAPDGQPQLLWSAPPQASGIGSYFDQPSADGEAFYICPFSAPTCHVGLQDAVAPIEIVSSNFVTISPDDKWVFSACILYDVTGASRNLGCDASQLFPSFSQDASRLAIAFKGGAKVFTLATGEETVLPPAAEPINLATLTPDGKRIVGFSNAGTFVASVSDGEWTLLTTDPYSVRGVSDFPIGIAVSPDSRIIAANSLSAGVVEAVDGEPVRVVTENGAPLLHATPVFEPAGGHGRAIFYERNATYHPVTGNADGSGDWVALPSSPIFRWTGHSVLSNMPSTSVPGVIHYDGSIAPGAYDLFVTPATGTPSLLVSSAVRWFVADSVDHPVLFFVPTDGALYSIPVPQPAP